MTERGHDIEPDQSEYERLGVTPRPTTEPASAHAGLGRPVARTASARPEVDYTSADGCVGQHLIDVHDMLRSELGRAAHVLGQVREGALGAGDARAALNEMALRQNDWTLGASAPATAAPSHSTTGSRTTRSSPTSRAASRRSRP